MKRNCRWFLLRSLPLLALALCLLLADLAPAASAVTQADIDALKSDAKGLAQEKKDIQAQIDKLSSDISTTMERKRLLDGQIGVTEQEIGNKEEEIATYEDLIARRRRSWRTRRPGKRPSMSFSASGSGLWRSRGRWSTGPCCSGPTAFRISWAAWTW